MYSAACAYACVWLRGGFRLVVYHSIGCHTNCQLHSSEYGNTENQITPPKCENKTPSVRVPTVSPRGHATTDHTPRLQFCSNCCPPLCGCARWVVLIHAADVTAATAAITD